MSEDELRKDVARAVRLREWAHGDEGLFAIFDQVKAAYMATIADTKPSESAEREQLYYRMKALSDLRKVMEVTIAKGAGAGKMIVAMTKKAEKKQQGKTPNVA